MTLMRETWILVGICLADLAATLGLTSGRTFSEGNPIMKFYLDVGIWAFVGVKLVLIVMPLIVAEYSKRFKPDFVRVMLRFAIVAYIGAYLALFLSFNFKPLAREVMRSSGDMPGTVEMTR